MTAEEQLAAGLRTLQLDIDRLRQNQLLEYTELLAKWNRVYNLTALRDPTQMVSHHLLDSLAVSRHVGQDRLLDVGAGAGLPGVPLAIARPQLEVTLLEPNQKRVAFLRQVVATLKLKNVVIIPERVEHAQVKTLFPAIISRAFSELADFVESAKRLLLPGGVIYAMKGTYPHEEIDRLPPQFRVREVVRLQVPMLDAERHLVIVERVE